MSAGSLVFNLPDLGEGLTEAEITEWLVQDGDEVAIDQHVVVVETAKASVEVPCPYAGTVSTRHGAEGDVLEVGQPLITIAGAGGAATAADAPAADAEGSEEGSGAVLVGYGTTDAGGSRRHRRSRRMSSASGRNGTAVADRPTERPPSPSLRAVPEPGEAQDAGGAATGYAPKVISPIVRRLARERGLDLRSIAPGADGVIRRSQVEAAAAPARAHSVTDAGDERIAITGLRRMVGEKLSRSRREIPDATTWVDVDATGLLEAREALRSEHDDVSLLGLLARICVAGLQRFPDLNTSVDVERAEIVRHHGIHVGFAAQSPRGLVVPVVRDADRMGTRELSTALRDLTARARQDALSPAELTGGTFTLNNYGVFGVDGSTPIINHPEAAMIGVGRITDKPWVVDGQLAVRKVTQLSLTFDHRVCDGGVAGGFLRFVADCVEAPVRVIG